MSTGSANKREQAIGIKNGAGEGFSSSYCNRPHAAGAATAGGIRHFCGRPEENPRELVEKAGAVAHPKRVGPIVIPRR